MPSKKINKNFLIFVSSIILLFLYIMSFSLISANAAQDFFSDDEINAYAITRFQDGLTEYEVRLSWSALEGADEYRIYKSINEGEFEEISTDDYEDEGFQLWWTDDDILEGYTYSYYIEGYWQDESVGITEQVYVDFWLPSCPAEYPVNNEIVSEENPEFKWESIDIDAFPFRNVIFSAEGEFILYDLTDDKEIRRIEIEDINKNSIRLIQEEEAPETTDEGAIDTETQIETDNDLDSVIDVENESELDVGPDTASDVAPDNDDDNEPLLIKKHQYQWQYKVTGFDVNNQATAESVTGGMFGFQEEVEEISPEEEEEEEEDVEGGLNIDAESLNYQIVDGEDVIIARDKVNLRYEDIILKANYLQIIIDKNELIAKDNVFFTKGEESYSCQALNYNWDTDKIIMDELSGETTGEKIKGKVYYQGEKLENFPETIEISSGVFTTCDLEKPHWHIEAEQITIYPDDKIIAKKISWYEGEKKIFTLPSFMIFLKGKNQLPYIPDIGQSSSEGWFLKNQFNYVEDETSYGSIYLDLMEKKGLGTGIEHTFELGEKATDDGEAVLYFYGLKRKNTNIFDLDAKIDYWQNFENNLRLKANLNYDGTLYPNSSSQNSTHILKPDFYLYKKWEDALLKLTGKYNFNISDTVTSSGNIKLSYDSTLTDKIKSNFDLLYNSQGSGDQPIEHQLRPEWLLRYSGDGYTLSLITEKQIDLNEGIFASGNSSKVLDKLPELTFKKSKAKIKNTDINYSIDASIARYYEGARKYTGKIYF